LTPYRLSQETVEADKVNWNIILSINCGLT
jgi:hypothetical protein